MELAISADEISHDFETAVALGVDWGIRFFELKRVHRKRVPDISDEERALILKVVKDHEVQITSISPGLFKIPLEAGLVKTHLGRRLDQSFELARDLGTEKIVVFGFIHPEPEDNGTVPQQVVDYLGQAADRAVAEGFRLFLENEPVCWAGSSETVAGIAEAIGSSGIGINWDPCNDLDIPGHKPYPDGYEKVKPGLGHLHMKDARHLPDGRVQYVVIGEGDVDWRGQLRALQNDRYTGYCVIETHFGVGVRTSKACIESAQKMFAELGLQAETDRPGQSLLDPS